MTKENPFILHALSPTKIVSPFDINMAYDSGFDNVATYTNITIDDISDLVQDIIFSRHPNDCKKTGLFISGEDAEEAIEMLEKAKKAMVSPFEISVFADPAGSFTTAAAMIACVKHLLANKFKTDLQGWAVNQLVSSGIDKEKINVINKCTYCSNALYHSYRRSGTNAGRMFALVGWLN